MTVSESRSMIVIGALAVLLVGVIAAVVLFAGSSDDGDDRQGAVAARGAEVMPFDLDQTTHRFETTDSGGVQTLVADPGADADQVALIREHLAAEKENFARGDFSDPMAIHGDEMPGVAQLASGADAVQVVYEEVPDGARLVYTTDDRDLVDAIHHWFEAQLADHGAHAEE